MVAGRGRPATADRRSALRYRAARWRTGGATLTVTAPDVDGLKFDVPTNDAVMLCAPTVRNSTGSTFATPLASATAATTFPPSNSSTVPDGVASVEATVARRSELEPTVCSVVVV